MQHYIIISELNINIFITILNLIIIFIISHLEMQDSTGNNIVIGIGGLLLFIII